MTQPDLSGDALRLLWDIQSTLAQGDEPIVEDDSPNLRELVDAGLVVWHGRGMCFPTCRMLVYREALPPRRFFTKGEPPMPAKWKRWRNR